MRFISQVSERCTIFSDVILPSGDVAEVFYRNSSEVVQRALSRLLPSLQSHHVGLIDGNSVLSVARNVALCGHRPSRVTSLPPITLVELFSSILNINTIPKRSFFASMAVFAADDAERDKLVELSTGAGTDLYFDYCIKEKRNFIEVLEEFPSVRPTLNALLATIPVIQPRQYSIASSAAVDNCKVGLCIAVVKYRTRLGRSR